MPAWGRMSHPSRSSGTRNAGEKSPIETNPGSQSNAVAASAPAVVTAAGPAAPAYAFSRLLRNVAALARSGRGPTAGRGSFALFHVGDPVAPADIVRG